MNVKCRSGLPGTRCRLRDCYADCNKPSAAWARYSETYGLYRKLGFSSAKEAWAANPVIEYSTDPSDYRLVKTNGAFPPVNTKLPAGTKVRIMDPMTSRPKSYLHKRGVVVEHRRAMRGTVWQHGVLLDGRQCVRFFLPCEIAEIR